MAYTVSTVKKTVFGDLRVNVLNVTADAASGAIDAGVGVVVGFSVGPISMATGAPLIKANQNSAATALNGSVFIKNAATGDNFYLVVYGR